MDARLTSASPSVAGSDPNRIQETLRLVDLSPGHRGRLLAAHLERDDLALLHALGLAERSAFRLCKAGEPWIVQVRGTRIGLSQTVAEMLQVERVLDDAKMPGECADDCACTGDPVVTLGR